MPSANPGHNWTLLELGASLRDYCRQTNIGVVLPETEFSLGDHWRLKPDLAVLTAEVWRTLDRRKVPVQAIPLLTVEIVSPSENAWTLDQKIQRYLASGVAEVWVLFAEGRHIYVHSVEGVKRFGEGQSLSSPHLPGWSVPVADLFADPAA
jgi:Uma2 family endonuclease